MLNKIVESVNGNTQYIMFVIIASIVGIVLTFLINMTSRKLKFIKYIPGLLLIFIGMFSLIIVLNSLFDRESLNNIIISLIALTSGACSLIFGLCIGIYNKDRYPDGYIDKDSIRRRQKID